MDDPLFAEMPRDDPNPRYAAETTFRFLQRVNDPVFERVRDTFNDWFARFARLQSQQAVNDLRGRFSSKQDLQFYAAFWELYLHEVHARLGFDVEVHPAGPRATQPDFCLSRGDERFYMEAVMPTPSAGNDSQPKSVATVLEYLNAAFDPDFVVAVRFVTAGAETPRRRSVIGAVEGWLKTLSWDDWRDDAGIGHPGPETELSIRDWVIGLQAIPRSRQARGDRDYPTIVVYPGMAGWVDSVISGIGPALDEKASKYGDLDAPLVVAAWVMSALASDASLAQALFGRSLPNEVGRHQLQPPEAERRSGLWTPDRSRRGRPAAVLLAGSWDFNYSAVSRAMPRLWKNPWSELELTAALPFATSCVSADERSIDNRQALISPNDLLELPPDWPGVPFA